jgi:hypothetical protein
MAGVLSLKTPSTGLVTLTPTDTATDKTITLPATTGTVVIQDGTSTATVTNLAYTGTLTGGTGVVNLGSGQVYKDASGNVGIGTASPAYKFEVQGSVNNFFGQRIYNTNAGSSAVSYLQIGNDTNGAATQLGLNSSTNTTNIGGANALYLVNGLSAPVVFGTSNSERMRIDSSGNVGIGTSSPASNAGFGGLTLNGTSGSLFDLRVANTLTFRVGTTSTENLLQGISNVPMTFYTNNSERMRLDSSGNIFAPFSNVTQSLVVGGNGATSSLGARICVKSPITAGASLNYAMHINDSNTNTAGGLNLIAFSHNSEDYSAGNVRASMGATIDGGGAGSLVFRTGGFGSQAERMRLDSSGNLLVGTQSPALNSQSTIVGASVGGTFSLAVIHNAADSAVRGILSRCPNYSGDDGYLFIGNRVVSDVIYIKTNGNVLNLNNSYGALSDIKLKENIVPASSKLDNLMQVEIVNYNLKDQPEQKLLGVVAQQLEQVFPSMVEETSDRDVDGKDLGTKTKSVKYSVFVPMLIKAIQEQQALIQNLTTRLNTLEGN